MAVNVETLEMGLEVIFLSMLHTIFVHHFLGVTTSFSFILLFLFFIFHFLFMSAIMGNIFQSNCSHWNGFLVYLTTH